MKTDECKKCEYRKTFYSQFGDKFLGCTYPPYKSKWVVEIKICPKEKRKTAEKE